MADQPTTPHLEYDPEARAAYIYLETGHTTEEQVEIEVPGSKTKKKILVDLDENGEIIGIEIILA